MFITIGTTLIRTGRIMATLTIAVSGALIHIMAIHIMAVAGTAVVGMVTEVITPAEITALTMALDQIEVAKMAWAVPIEAVIMVAVQHLASLQEPTMAIQELL